MFGLPEKTEQNLPPLSKTKIFGRFKVSRSDQELFNADISTMFIANHVSAETVPALKPGKKLKGFYVVVLNLKHEKCSPKNLELLSRLVPQKMIFVLKYNDCIKFAVHFENIFETDSIAEGDAKLLLKGYDVDEVWENLVKSIGKIKVEGDNTLVEQIALNDDRASLQKKIEDLTSKAYKEKQPRRKMELLQKIGELKKQQK